MIPLVRLHGSHRKVGAQLGAALAEPIRRAVAAQKPTELPAGYREATVEHFPWVVEELDVMALMAGVDRDVLFATMVEEVTAEDSSPVGRCTDVVRRSADGHLLVAHNNDYTTGTRDDVVAIDWQVEGRPRTFTIGIGHWLSVGWNDAGLSVTGNELTQNDQRIGIPRLLLMRAVLACETLEEAVECVLHPARASSYNWVLATPDRAVNVEGSATSAVTRELEPGSALVHTNHYVEAEMTEFEADTAYARRSAIRCERARELALALGDEGSTPAGLRSLLADHEHAPDSLCRHGGETETIFWCVADVTAGHVTYGLGNPCNSTPQEHAFA